MGVSVICLLLLVKDGLSSPYYYRESKEHSEHHKEVSSSQGGTSLPELQGGALLKPERYSTYVYPSVASTYSQGGSLYQPSVPTVTSQRIVHSSSSSSPVIVTRKVVKMYSYPGASTQSGYFQVGGSELQTSDAFLKPLHSEGGSLGGSYSRLQEPPYAGNFGSAHNVERHYEHRQSGGASSSLLGLDDLGQRPVDTLGFYGETQKLERPSQSVRFESYHKQEGSLLQKPTIGNIDIPRELFTSQQPLDLGQTVEKESLYSSKYSSLEQQPIRVTESLYPTNFNEKRREELDSVSHGLVGDSSEEDSGQQIEEESSYRKPKYGSLQVGGKDQLFGKDDVGQQVVRESSYHTTKQEVEHGEEDYGQTPVKDSLYTVGKYSSSQLGQKEVPTGESQKPKVVKESSYHSAKQTSIKVEHGEEDYGQIPVKDSLYNARKYSSIQLGQKEEPIRESQTPKVVKESSYHSAKQTSIKVEHGEEDYGQIPVKDSLYNAGKYSSIQLAQKEEPIRESEKPKVVKESSYHSAKQTSLKVEHGEEDYGQTPVKDSLYNVGKYSSIQLGHREVPMRESQVEKVVKESSHHSSKQTVVELGQGEDDLGQEVVKDSLYVGKLNPGGRTEDVGQEVERGDVHLGKYSQREDLGQEVVRESPVLHHVSLETTELLGRGDSSDELVQHKEKPTFHNGKYGSFDVGQKREFEESKLFGQEVEKETSLTFPPRRVSGYGTTGSSIILGQVPPTQISQGYHEVHSWQGGKSCTLCEQTRPGSESALIGHLKNVQETEQVESSRPKLTSTTLSTTPGMVSYSSSSWKKNHTTVEIHKSVPLSPESYTSTSGQSQVRQVSSQVNKKPLFEGNPTLNQKVEDLALSLVLGDFSKLPESSSTVSSHTVVQSSVTPVHTAEIQELGFENLNTQSPSQRLIISQAETPARKGGVFQTHSEEYGYDYPPRQTSYSKETSEHYSMREERRSSGGKLTATSGDSAGGKGWDWRGLKEGGEEVESVQKRDVYQAGPSRQSDIDSFLTELDRDIAGENKKQSGSTFTRVSTQEQHQQQGQYPSQYPTSSVYGQTSHTSVTGTSGGGSSSSSSWYKKIGDNIGSAYSKAKERLGQTYTQAKDKAKEIVTNVRTTMT